MNLYVPQIEDDADVISAAIAYAKAGWYVLPLQAATKRPALGKGWPSHTSRDPKQIVEWFAGTDHALGLHVGRSGAIVFDVDDPDVLPEVLNAAFIDTAPPFQSSRVDVPRKGHYVYAQPAGRYLGNSRGELNTSAWGEVRGANGYIAVAPSAHAKAETGGRYEWMSGGPVPPLPRNIARMLPEFTGSNGAASTDSIQVFFDTFASSTRESNLVAITNGFAKTAAIGSRHEALVDHLAWAMREAAMGFFPAAKAAGELWNLWEGVIGAEAGRFPRSEFDGVLAWAVGAALADADRLDARRDEITQRLEPVATPAPGPVAIGAPPVDPPAFYFDKDGLDVSLLSDAILRMGPLALGDDGAFWSYESGVWRRSPTIVEGRTVGILRGRFRMAHAGNAAMYVKHQISSLTCDPTPDHMNFENGMLEWKTGKIVPHDPAFGSTVQFPYNFDADAECPRFDAFLASVLTEDYVQLAWEMIGYLLMSGNPLQKAFMLLGAGGNGKGTLIRLIEAALGRGNIATQSLDALSTNRFAPVSLHAKIANLAGDIDKTYQESTAQFKMLTGEDTFTAEHKYGASFNFRNWAVPVFSANAVPGSADTSEGYLRRWVIVKFDRTIPASQRIPGYSEEMLCEVPGIAAKAVRALRAMMDRHSGRGGFHTSSEITSGADEFAEAIDQVRQWVNSGAVLVDPNAQETQSDVFKAYRIWAQDNHVGVLKSPELMHRLASIPGIKTGKTNGMRWVRGLTVYLNPRPGTLSVPDESVTT